MRKGAIPIDGAKTPARPGSGPPLSDVRRCYVNDQYPALVQNNRLKASDLRRLRGEASSFRYRPLVSILLPVFDPERWWLEEGLDSVLSQVYPRWELRICATGSAGERVRDILDRYERLEERIKVTYPRGETSVSASLNASLVSAGGEFVGS